VEDDELLLSEYQSLMESERTFYSSVGNSLAVGAAVAAAFLALAVLPKNLSLSARTMGWALIPAVPLVAGGYLGFMAVMGSLRGPYIRALEDALRVKHEPLTVELFSGVNRTGEKKQVAVPAQHRVIMPLVSPEVGPRSVRVLLGSLFIVPNLVAFGIITATVVASAVQLTGSKVPWEWDFLVGGYALCLSAELIPTGWAMLLKHRYWPSVWKNL
jgi:hypothetical protein